MMDSLRKLRALAMFADGKIWQNRNKARLAAKWPDNAYNSDGDRDWHLCSPKWLLNKLDEEVAELKFEVLTIHQRDLGKLRREGGDVAAVVMMLIDVLQGWEGSSRSPKVVCLCGSTKFKDVFAKVNFEETMKGHIVLSVGSYMHADKVILRDEEKEFLDDLHKRKIDLADEIFVINVGGYIGESTRSEIQHAIATGKDVRYLEDPFKQDSDVTPVLPASN